MILLDIQLEKVSGLKVGREIKSKYPTIPLVFLSGFDFEEYRYQAKKMNAQGFLLKGISYTELISVIRDVVIKGSKYTIDGKRVLTDSEKNILQFVSRGFTQESIATELSISKRTVSTHLQSIYRKMSVNSSAEALFKGIKLGIISKYD